jgi:hypothetical protein
MTTARRGQNGVWWGQMGLRLLQHMANYGLCFFLFSLASPHVHGTRMHAETKKAKIRFLGRVV